MKNESKAAMIKKIQLEYHQKLKELEAKLAVKHKELTQIKQGIKHESKKIYHSKLSILKSKRNEINASILNLKKEIKQINKERIKKLRKLK
ncbi:MAG: hypothetical protein ACFFAK_14140 [Promethearchaeota archaeon]